MIDRVLEIFLEITKLPHCSGDTLAIREYIKNHAKKLSYKIKEDSAHNLLAYKKEPKLSFQSHMDMVCVGKAPNIKTIIKDGWIEAKDSSLGADNGIGIAIMLYLMENYDNLEFLFTNDEEIGLIGAFNLELPLQSKYLINLDSEDENIYIGCAGGVEANITYPIKKEKKKGFIFDIEITNLPGGHSGVDIDKDIPNAIKLLSHKVDSITNFSGGERINSIPTSAFAKEFRESKYGKEVELFSKDYIEFIRTLPNGVISYDKEFNVVSQSINLALVNNENIHLYLRANSNEELEELKKLINKLPLIHIKYSNQYPAWKPKVTKLAKIFKEISKSNYKVIHAGLECSILTSKYPNIEIISVGPIIQNPHSIRERVKIESIATLLKNLEKLIEII